MLWQNLTFLYALKEMKKQSTSSFTYALLAVFVGLVQTVLYYTYQSFYAFFLFSYISSVVVIVFWTGYLAFDLEHSATKGKDSAVYDHRYKLWTGALFYYVIVGASLWVFEMNFCDMLLPYYLNTTGLSLHVVWHFGAAFGTYLVTVFLIVVRLQTLGHGVHLNYILYVIPIANVHKKK